MPSAREVESTLLTWCALVAQGAVATANDSREANLCRVASMLLRSRFPAVATHTLCHSLSPDEASHRRLRFHSRLHPEIVHPIVRKRGAPTMKSRNACSTLSVTRSSVRSPNTWCVWAVG